MTQQRSDEIDCDFLAERAREVRVQLRVALAERDTALARAERADRHADSLRRTCERVEAMVAGWEADEREHLMRFGQHIPCSLATLSEAVRVALGGTA